MRRIEFGNSIFVEVNGLGHIYLIKKEEDTESKMKLEPEQWECISNASRIDKARVFHACKTAKKKIQEQMYYQNLSWWKRIFKKEPK